MFCWDSFIHKNTSKKVRLIARKAYKIGHGFKNRMDKPFPVKSHWMRRLEGLTGPQVGGTNWTGLHVCPYRSRDSSASATFSYHVIILFLILIMVKLWHTCHKWHATSFLGTCLEATQEYVVLSRGLWTLWMLGKMGLLLRGLWSFQKLYEKGRGMLSRSFLRCKAMQEHSPKFPGLVQAGTSSDRLHPRETKTNRKIFRIM